jgi:deoxyribodipyrimidine photo-lyase
MARPRFLDYRGQTTPVPPNGASQPFDPVERRRRWLRKGRPRTRGGYVVYWMQMAKRARANIALNEAIRWANELDLPLVVYEGLNFDYPQANDRVHRFILECARDTAAELKDRGIRYVFYLQRDASDESKPAAELIRDAAACVTDDYPTFILPGITNKTLKLTKDSEVPMLAVDGMGVTPMAEIDGLEVAARTIRPKIHARMPSYLFPIEDVEPRKDSTSFGAPVAGIEAELRGASDEKLDKLVASCDIDHEVLPSLRYRGGRRAALAQLERFMEDDLPEYAKRRNDPGNGCESGLSSYLHFGCVAPQEVAVRVLEDDSVDEESTEGFLEQLCVRRELSINFCRRSKHHTTLHDLPNWANRTLAEHKDDPRDPRYDDATMERAATEDPIWNAAQRELVSTGTFHNYLRMLWGKNVIRWTKRYSDAQRFMIRMHCRYALDGRDPNTYANILWCFGLHDRPFQERPILGSVRPLNSKNTDKKFHLSPYFERVDAWTRERDMPILRR